MTKLNATLVILTKNEISGLNALFDKIPINKVKDVFAIDYNSTDGTVEFFKKKRIRVIRQEKKGRAEAFRIGCKNAKYENMVFFSPDGNEDPEDIIKLFSLLEKGYDMVIASRFMKDSRADDSDKILPFRGLGNKFFTALVNILWKGNYTDSINGFRGIKKSKLALLKPDAEGFGIEYQISIRSLKHGFRIKEIPTYEGDRIGGKSTAHAISTGFYFIKLTIMELLSGKKY